VQEAWRWITVLPAATGAYIAVMLISAMAVSSELPHDPLPPPTGAIHFYEMVANPIAGFLFVWIGARIAPSRKSAVAVSLAVVFGIGYTFLVMSGLEMASWRRFYIQWSMFRGLLAVIGTIAGVTTLHNQKIQEERSRYHIPPESRNN
jgi:hypothetical protein